MTSRLEESRDYRPVRASDEAVVVADDRRAASSCLRVEKNEDTEEDERRKACTESNPYMRSGGRISSKKTKSCPSSSVEEQVRNRREVRRGREEEGDEPEVFPYLSLMRTAEKQVSLSFFESPPRVESSALGLRSATYFLLLVLHRASARSCRLRLIPPLHRTLLWLIVQTPPRSSTQLSSQLAAELLHVRVTRGEEGACRVTSSRSCGRTRQIPHAASIAPAAASSLSEGVGSRRIRHALPGVRAKV
eukprot:755217-Hanusia_phi.AAC.2